jgi:zinc finger protein
LAEPKLIHEEVMICPHCRAHSLKVSHYVFDSGKTGNLWIAVMECTSCGYRSREVMPLEWLEPKVLELEVRGEEDLRVIVHRSPHACLELPELGISVEPGPASHGVITTVEGILEEVIDVAEQWCEGCDLERVRRAMRGELKFRLIIRDPSGLSFIESERTSVRPFEGCDIQA